MPRIAIGSDHAGYELKQHFIGVLTAGRPRGRSTTAPTRTESVDYPPFCAAVGRAVRDGEADVGIVLGGSGQGEQLAANKVRGVRAALCNDLYTARLARAHNDANVLDDRRAGGRRRARRGDPGHVPRHRVRGRPPRPPRRPDHDDRSRRITNGAVIACRSHPTPSPTPSVRPASTREVERQTTGLQLIASENFTSPAVHARRRVGADQQVLRGLPGQALLRRQRGHRRRRGARHRARQGAVRRRARQRAAALAAPTPTCARTRRCSSPATPCSGLSLDHGGHLTHGSPVNASGMLYHFVAYKVTPGDERIDFDQVRDLALEHRPKMIVAGTTSYPRRLDPEPFRAIADEVGALFMFDAAHLAGLIAGGAHPEPGAVRRRRHVHDAQDAARPARRLHPVARPSTPRRSTRPCSPAGRAARSSTSSPARRSRSARRAPELQRVRPPDRAPTPSALAEALAGEGFRLVSRRHRQPPDGRRPAPVRRRAHRQGGPERARRGRHHARTRTPSPTIRAARSSRAACASARRRSRPRAWRRPRWPQIASLIARALRDRDDARCTRRDQGRGRRALRPRSPPTLNGVMRRPPASAPEPRR